MDEMIVKKIIGGQPASLLGKTTPKVKNTTEFNKVLDKTIQELNKAQNQADKAAAIANSGKLNQLSDVKEAIKQTQKLVKEVMQSRQKIINAYQQIVDESKKKG